MLELFVALALAALGTSVVALHRRMKPLADVEPVPALPGNSRNLLEGDLLPGDAIEHLETDFLVEGVLTCFEADEPSLVIAQLSEGVGSRWLLVQPGPAPRCWLLHHRDNPVGDGPLPAVIQDGPCELRLTRRTALRIRTRGTTPFIDGAASEVGLFDGPGQRVALFMRTDEATLFLVGRLVTNESLQLFPRNIPQAADHNAPTNEPHALPPKETKRG